jgi:hypothetical protein
MVYGVKPDFDEAMATIAICIGIINLRISKGLRSAGGQELQP